MTALRQQRAFTLIEILVALFVFAIIGLISSQLMSQSIRANEQLMTRGDRLADIQRALYIIQRDVLQITRRSIRDGFGDPQPHLLVGTDGAIEFSRSGWRNPLQLPRAETQRVAYLAQDNALVRGFWPVLDRAQDTEPAYQTLLEEVEQLEFYILDNAGNEHTFWPQPGLPPDLFEVAVVMRIDAAPFGVIERVWSLPGVPTTTTPQ